MSGKFSPMFASLLHIINCIIVSQLAVISAPLVGGSLTQYASWRWCTYCIPSVFLLPNFCLTPISCQQEISLISWFKRYRSTETLILTRPGNANNNTRAMTLT